MPDKLRSQIIVLREFQRKRLWDSYSDFANKPEYNLACRFFFDTIYGGENDPERDEAFRRLHKELTRLLGGEVIDLMRQVIELQELSLQLDELVARAMLEEGGYAVLDMESYARLYKRAGTRTLREKQLWLLLRVLRASYQLFHQFGIAPGLRALHAFQKLRGQEKSTAFLLEGMNALRLLPQVEDLVAVIETREKALLNQWFAESHAS